jgi:hypothetical protein
LTMPDVVCPVRSITLNRVMRELRPGRPFRKSCE